MRRGGAALQRGVLVSAGAAAAALLALAPLYGSPDLLLLAISALIFCLLALSLNLLVGTTGLISFGHAAFFGVGAYTVGILVSKHGWPPLAALAVAPVLGAAFAFAVGLFTLRASELYFSLLTLGVAQLCYVTAQGWTGFTGGSDGIHGDFSPDWLFDLDNLYWFVLGVVAVCAAVLFVVTRSPFGMALRGIGQNRRRAEFNGIHVRGYELAAFAIAGAVAAVAGGLFAVSQDQAFPGLMHWTFSALPVIMTLLGGIGVFLGPVAGAFAYTFLNDEFAARTVYWDVIVGAILILVALLVPTGLLGGLRRLVDRTVGAPPRAPDAAASVRPRLAAVPAVSARPERQLPVDGPPILDVTDVGIRFGGLVAVDGVSLAVHPGTVHAVIGPNGAGKSTFFNLVTGLLAPDQGRVVFEGRDVTGLPPWKLVQRGMGRSFQQATVFLEMTVRENLLVALAAVRGNTRRAYGRVSAPLHDEVGAILENVGLERVADVPARELSHGDQRLLEIATAVALGARLVLLDEPTAGLSLAETRTSTELIRHLASEHGLTVLFIEHDMDVVFGVADRITVLDRGKVLAEGTPAEIRDDPRVRRAYLGEEGDAA